MNRFLVPFLLLVPALIALPAASAHHTCEDVTRVDVQGYDAGVYGVRCVGFDAAVIPVECERVIWGYHAEDYGVGGLRNCEAGAYVHWVDVANAVLP